MDAVFQDIVIIDLDVRKTTWSRVHSSMRTVYVKLSGDPPSDWARYFHEERSSRVRLRRHGLWVEDGYIVLDCLLDEFETEHLPDIRLSVAYANLKCREQMQEHRAQDVATQRNVIDEKQQLIQLQRVVRGSAPAAAMDSMPTPDPVGTEPTLQDQEAELDAKRSEWRERFRAALISRTKGA